MICKMNNKLFAAQNSVKSGKEAQEMKNIRMLLIIAIAVMIAVVAALAINADEQRAEVTYSGATLVLNAE